MLSFNNKGNPLTTPKKGIKSWLISGRTNVHKCTADHALLQDCFCLQRMAMLDLHTWPCTFLDSVLTCTAMLKCMASHASVFSLILQAFDLSNWSSNIVPSRSIASRLLLIRQVPKFFHLGPTYLQRRRIDPRKIIVSKNEQLLLNLSPFLGNMLKELAKSEGQNSKNRGLSLFYSLGCKIL